ncbi:MAG: ScyD/ScyE family protein [Bacillota bacterium]
MKGLIIKSGLGMVIVSLLFLVSCSKDAESPTEVKKMQDNSVLGKVTHKEFITIIKNLNQPRGLRFGPDGMLYVGESGTKGYISSQGECEQVLAPVGPYLGGNNGSITRTDLTGSSTHFADSLPSTQGNIATGGNLTSISSLGFYNGELYATLSGAGCSHGHPEIPNGILKFDNTGKWKLVADISSFLKNNPVAQPEADDFEPDGDIYSMVVVEHYIYFIESNHGELDRFDIENNKIERVADISKLYGHIVPTALAYKDGYFYVGNLTTIPFPKGSARILKISRDGNDVSEYLKGFTTILGLEFDKAGNLFVLETSAKTEQPPFFFPNTGKVSRINSNGSVDEITCDLNFPTAMTFGPDGSLYVSNSGFNTAPGEGEIVKINIPNSGKPVPIESRTAENF